MSRQRIIRTPGIHRSPLGWKKNQLWKFKAEVIYARRAVLENPFYDQRDCEGCWRVNGFGQEKALVDISSHSLQYFLWIHRTVI